MNYEIKTESEAGKGIWKRWLWEIDESQTTPKFGAM